MSNRQSNPPDAHNRQRRTSRAGAHRLAAAVRTDQDMRVRLAGRVRAMANLGLGAFEGVRRVQSLVHRTAARIVLVKNGVLEAMESQRCVGGIELVCFAVAVVTNQMRDDLELAL